jgi:hypothetical protein
MTPFRLWVYLQTTPLFWLTATLAAFLVADALAKAAGRRPIVNHVLIAIALLGGLLELTGTDYQTYFNGAQFVHFLPASDGRAWCPDLCQLRARQTQCLAACGGFAHRRDGGDRVRGAGRESVRRAAGDPDRARAEVDHGRRRDGRD